MGRALVAGDAAGKLVKIGAKVTRHAKHVAFQLAEVAVTRSLSAAILDWMAVGDSAAAGQSVETGVPQGEGLRRSRD